MTGIKHSRQRDAIKENLRNRSDHPTADMIYMDIRVQYPNISLGTVYRNLALLTEIGEILHIPSVNGADRYDGNMEPHSHFICRQCGGIQDLPPVEAEILRESIGELFDGVIEETRVVFSGLCGVCFNERSE